LGLKQAIIMDNASIHKPSRIREMIENVGRQLLYLPPHSPDLNPIQHDWAWLKNQLSHLSRHATNYFERFSLSVNFNYETSPG
jgi:transposase